MLIGQIPLLNNLFMILSILIPTYNRSKFLEKNLQILNQHIHKIDVNNTIEIVVSNNGSPVNTDNI